MRPVPRALPLYNMTMKFDDCLYMDAFREDLLRRYMPTDGEAYALADFFSVCADPTRVKIFSALATGDMCVGDLACAVGMHPSTISHQLKLLRDKGMVSVRRRGKVVYYSLSDPAVEAALDIGANRLARRA